MKTLKYLPLLSLLFAGSALSESKWGIGLGGLVQDNGYIDLGTEVNLLPVIYYESGNFSVLGPQFHYEFADLEGFEFSFVGRLNFGGYEEDDGDIFIGMEERSGSIDLGVEVEYESDYGDFSFSYLTDATSEHEGSELSVKYSLPFIFESSMVTPYIGYVRQSEEMVDYYYGVRANEATLARPFYQGEAASSIEIGVQSLWRFGKHHNVVGNLSFATLADEIKDSPLVDASNNVSLILGYLYVF